MARREPLSEDGGMLIALFEAEVNNTGLTTFPYTRLHLCAAATMIIQLVIAAVPLILCGEWGVLLVTGIGTILALAMGRLPQ
jgi:hypothetical protein